MSELKAVHAFDVYEAYTKTGDDDAAQVYLKSEADKVIAELERRLNEAHTELELWRDGSIISEEHQKELDEIRLHWEEIEQTRAENERMKARISEIELQFGWRSFKNDPPKANGIDDFVFCGHQRYAYQSDAETEYFVDYGCLDMNDTLCMFNDWHEGQEIFEIDYWFPLPRHPDEPKKETKEEK